MIALLSKSDVYREYEHAFVAATGLPLGLHAPDMITVIRHSKRQENPFCALMVKTSQWCTASYVLQRKVENAAQNSPKTLRDFAGLCETSVPVRVGGNVIAFLQTGQILLHQPDHVHFDEILRTLKLWNSPVDRKKVEAAWFNSPVHASKQYEALVRLLDIFAHQLAACSNALILDHGPRQRPEISKACLFITDHCGDDMSLSAMARIANMSANYFSGKFVEATGMNFVEYVTRTRIEKACTLLQNPDLRISEIAFDVGFQSLSQFNRGFKQVSGQCPRDYRDALATPDFTRHQRWGSLPVGAPPGKRPTKPNNAAPESRGKPLSGKPLSLGRRSPGLLRYRTPKRIRKFQGFRAAAGYYRDPGNSGSG